MSGLRYVRRCVIALCTLLFATTAFAEPSALEVTVTTTAVTVRNVTPGGQIVLFSCSRGTLRGRIHVQPNAITLADDDRDGTVQHRPETAIPLRSVWAAIDTTAGSVAVAGQEGFRFANRSFALGSFRKDAAGELSELAQERPRLVVLVVRPGKGAWVLRAKDGGPSDRDRMSDGRLSIAFEDMTPIDGKEKGPKHVKRGDVVVAIDPGHLDVWSVEVSE